MNKFFISAAMGAALLGATVMPAFASTERLNWGSQIDASQCEGIGAPIVNVDQKVLNDVDSGFAGYWAFDTFNRTIKLFSTYEPGIYCASVTYTGKFTAIGGQKSPDGISGILDGTEKGTVEGGYTATIVGGLLTNPSWKTNGNIGTYDYMCDVNGNCPGAVDWVAQYFGPLYNFKFNFWGWIYHGGSSGTWVNATTSSSGNIL